MERKTIRVPGTQPRFELNVGGYKSVNLMSGRRGIGGLGWKPFTGDRPNRVNL